MHYAQSISRRQTLSGNLGVKSRSQTDRFYGMRLVFVSILAIIRQRTEKNLHAADPVQSMTSDDQTSDMPTSSDDDMPTAEEKDEVLKECDDYDEEEEEDEEEEDGDIFEAETDETETTETETEDDDAEKSNW